MNCKHEIIKPIVEKDDKGRLVVYAEVCQSCFSEFVISPMTLVEYTNIVGFKGLF